MKQLLYTLLLIAATALAGCKTDYANLPTFTGARQLQAVIEVPAGNNLQLRYDADKREFVKDKDAGQDRIIEFLPFPGNYGFIPSTEVGKNGRGLNIIVLSERAETGSVLEVIPVGVLQLEQDGDLKPIIVAVPARPSERTIEATTLANLSKDYPAAKEILRQWFMHKNPTIETRFVAWRDEKFADQEIQRWMKL
ncbi:inorganic diphosphatase [Pontibacter sp. MBLB2868]|uniref:inorganic diphosphatase n=1 Tax=Pontibacter sp. MBLB2868 TaxID=3451555 RepID=UPI003F74DA4A